MTLDDLDKPAIPAAYGQLVLAVAGRSGARREEVLQGLGISPTVLAAVEGRLTLMQISKLMVRALKLSGNPGLGCEIGIDSSLTSHGFVGMGLVGHPTLRQTIEFGIRFVLLRTPFFSMRLFEEPPWAVVEVSERLPFGPLRQVAFDLFLCAIARMIPVLTAGQLSLDRDLELWFDYPEPDYFARYREHLPALRFSMPANQLRLPASTLDLPLKTANLEAAHLATQLCERELAVLGFGPDFVGGVRAAIVNQGSGYPKLEEVAGRLAVSGRTLKRRLRESGTSYQKLLDEIRRRDSLQLLKDPRLSISAVAHRMGFEDPANFTRAFRSWTGRTPSGFRSAPPD